MLQGRWMAAARYVLLTTILISGPTWAQEPSGLVTTRLSAKEAERWRAIEAIALAVDENHQPLHPTLWGMWQWIETSGHAVYIEVVRKARVATTTAGTFMIERADPRGERHTGVIRLNLSNIDLAYVGPSAARADGFIPFEKLSREERYVEVLAHELSHAVHILTSLDRAKQVEESIEKTNELLMQFHTRRWAGIPAELKGRVTQRDALLEKLERQAEAMEALVWKELVASRSIRARAAAAVAP